MAARCGGLLDAVAADVHVEHSAALMRLKISCMSVAQHGPLDKSSSRSLKCWVSLPQQFIHSRALRVQACQ